MQLRGVGKAIEKHLARLDIFSVQDLLLHLPSRYQDRTRLTPIRQVVIGQEVMVQGTLTDVSLQHHGRTKLLCTFSDETGRLRLRFLHGHFFLKKILRVGVRLRLFGVARLGNQGLEMIHPEFRVMAGGQSIPIDSHLTPIYPTTKGLSQPVLRKLIDQALEKMEKENFFNELLPETMLQSRSLPTLQAALKWIHHPPRDAVIEELIQNKTVAQRRLIFEELLAHRVGLLHIKHIFQQQSSVPLSFESLDLLQAFRQSLLYTLTGAQERVLKEISDDLARPYPMLRLMQGEVGSGKTVVAALAMLQVIQHGYQAALMAPTELLAEQHYQVFKAWFEPLGVTVVFLSGAIKGGARKQVLEAIARNQAKVILGTHALFQKEVVFSKLAFIAVDEQHRFGVHQRALFREKALNEKYHPHQLIMTATPIPRTLAMSFYADLDCSVIDEMPRGRIPVSTSIVSSARRDEVIARIKKSCEEGRQAYWVCPLIEESDAIDAMAAVNMAAELQQSLKKLKVALLHGRMPTKEKDAIMQAFKAGEIHLLVATTVIEVGIDVKNASMMMIENADRLGLSQLHQLRGRVGRGTNASHCVLLYDPPLSSVGEARLRVMRETNDGFKIAEEDLALRGPGEVFGTHQTGEWSFRAADLMRDKDYLLDVKDCAALLISERPHGIEPLVERWVGKRKIYREI